MNNKEDVMFSVEVTTYNQKEYIAQTLQSIIDQDHNYKYEILVSDDCSKDGTQEVIKEFQIKYPDIIKPIYNEKNVGAMENYYANIKRAKGKYLMGCAGDDYWLPGKVQKQIDFMEKNQSFDVCYAKAQTYNNENKLFGSIWGYNYQNFKDLFNGNSIPALTLCIRREFFFKYLEEITPQSKDWLMEDYPFLLYTAFESKLFFLDELVAIYRIIENSVSHQKDLEKKLRFEKSVYDIRKFYSIRYSIPIEEWNEEEVIKSFVEVKTNAFLRYIKKIIKCFIPYGIIIIIRKIKESKR